MENMVIYDFILIKSLQININNNQTSVKNE